MREVPDITKEQVAKYIEYFYGPLDAEAILELQKDFSNKTVFFDVYTQTDESTKFRRERSYLDIPEDQELTLGMISPAISSTASLIITTDGRVLKNRFGN